MRHSVIENGVRVVRDMTAEEIAAWEAKQAADSAENAKRPLNAVQWAAMLEDTGLGTIVDAAIAALPVDTPEQRRYKARFKAVAKVSPDYTLDNTLALAAKIAAMGLPDVTVPDEATIRAAWADATTFNGAADL